MDDEVQEILDSMKQNAHVSLQALSEYKLNIEIVMDDVFEYLEPTIECYRRDKEFLKAWEGISSSGDVDAVHEIAEQIRSSFADEQSAESDAGDSLEERMRNLQRGDIPVLKSCCERFTHGGGKKVMRAIRQFVAILVECCHLNREKVKVMLEPVSSSCLKSSETSKKRSSSTAAESRPAKKRCTIGSDLTKKSPHPVKKPRQRTSSNKGATKKAPKRKKTSLNSSTIKANEAENEASKEKERHILRKGTARQKAKLRDQMEKAKEDATPEDDPEYHYVFERRQRAWSYLKKDNWTWVKRKDSLGPPWYYVRPGCCVEQGKVGEDYFLDLVGVIKYLKASNLLTKYIDRLHGQGKKCRSKPRAEVGGQVEPRRERALTTGQDSQAPILATTNDGNKPLLGTPLAQNTGMDPDGFKWSVSGDSEFLQGNQVGTSGQPPGGTFAAHETPRNAAASSTTEWNTGKENNEPTHFTPEMQVTHERLEELKTTARKAEQRIESADKAAQRVDAKKNAAQELRKRLAEQFARSVTFKTITDDMIGNTVKAGALIPAQGFPKSSDTNARKED